MIAGHSDLDLLLISFFTSPRLKKVPPGYTGFISLNRDVHTFFFHYFSAGRRFAVEIPASLFAGESTLFVSIAWQTIFA